MLLAKNKNAGLPRRRRRIISGSRSGGGSGGAPGVGENGRLVGRLDELVVEFRAIGGSSPDVRIFEES